MSSKIEIIQVPHLEGFPKIMCMMLPVDNYSIEQVQLANADEVATFATSKRQDEHLTGRFLLEHALLNWGVEVSMIEVRRNEYRAPSIAYLPGTWKRTKLPAISICHSSNWAFVALIENGWTIGIDAEPSDLEISTGVFDMMAIGDELDYLRNNPKSAVRLWTSKESIQKSARLGMSLNPRKIKIPIEERICKIPIEKSIFQLTNFTKHGFNISLSFGHGEGYDRTHEDDLLDLTKQAMDLTGDWTIGCKTTRSGN